MAAVSWAAVWSSRRGGGMLLLIWIFIVVRPSLPQPAVPLSLPVHMSVLPAAWRFLPLTQVELGPLFSNSSPFSASHSLFMVPAAPGGAPTPTIHASFGPYSVTQPISEHVVRPSPTLSASLLSQHVERERDERGEQVFRVRTLFHKQGDSSTRGTCITLHAFRETEEHRASCITQPPLGLCVVTLTLPTDWFNHQQSDQSHQDKWHGLAPRRRVKKWGRQHGRNHKRHLRYHRGVERDIQGSVPRGPASDQIQLYYSSMDTVADSELTPPGCVEEGTAQSQRQLFHIKAVTLEDEKEKEQSPESTNEEETCLNGKQEEELSLDSHVLIRYHRGPVLIGQPVRVSVKLRANFSSEFVVIRMKVKKGLVSMVSQRTLTSDLWTVTVERSHGTEHDLVSIICHKHSTIKPTHNPALFQQAVCLSVNGHRQSFGVAMTVSANWWVEYSGRNNRISPDEAAVSVFSFTDRHICGIAPITESNTIINTAILTNQPVSLPVIVLAISSDGKASDVTSAVTCHSTNENTVKVSSDCSSIFVDGSESGLGHTCAVVEFLLGTLSGSVCLEVWVPSVPLRISLADPVLNAIDGWNHFTEKGCVPVYQRSSFQVLTQFTAVDSKGQNTHLLGSSDWFVDVTQLVRDWLRVEDPRVAALGPLNNLIGLRPGRTSLHVVSEQWDGVLGRCDITVTSEPVTPGDLSVQVVSGLGMSVTDNPTHPSIFTTTVTAYNILYNHHQEASVSVWLQFSDDSPALLSSFSDLPFNLRLFSLAESVVVVTPGPSQRIFAQGDGGGPLLRAELLISTCDKPLDSNAISEDDSRDWTDNRGTRMLSGGSGWIRVNMDLGFLQPIGDKAGEFDFDISDLLIESGSDAYASNFHEDQSGNASSSDYYGQTGPRNGNEVANSGGGMVSRNTLERAVLKPSSHQPGDGPVYFSRSKEKEKEGKKRKKKEEEGGREALGAGELELGVGAVLSLLCVSALLFLANFLPCALRDRRKRRRIEQEEREGGPKGQEEEEKTHEKTEEEEREKEQEKTEEENREEEEKTEEEEREEEEKTEEEGRKKTECEDKIKQEEENNKEDVKEVEIVC